MTMIMWRMIKRFLPRDYVKEIREGDKSIELVNGHIIYAKSGDNPDSLYGERGYPLSPSTSSPSSSLKYGLRQLDRHLQIRGGRLSSSGLLAARPSTINST